MSSAAIAHPGDGQEIGALHVFLSIEHAVVFLGAGAFAGGLMLVRSVATTIVANGMLILLLVMQGVAHAGRDGLLHGVEVAVSGALLAMCGWRAVYLLYAQFAGRSHENRT